MGHTLSVRPTNPTPNGPIIVNLYLNRFLSVLASESMGNVKVPLNFVVGHQGVVVFARTSGLSATSSSSCDWVMEKDGVASDLQGCEHAVDP